MKNCCISLAWTESKRKVFGENIDGAGAHLQRLARTLKNWREEKTTKKKPLVFIKKKHTHTEKIHCRKKTSHERVVRDTLKDVFGRVY